jgi:hypothetical protein
MMSLAPFVLVAGRCRGCRCFRYSDDLMTGVSGVSELASGAGRRFGVVVIEGDSWVRGGRYLGGKQRIAIARVAAVDLQSFECLLTFCSSCQFGSFDSRKLKLNLRLKRARYGPVGESFLSFASSFSVCRMCVTCCSFSVMVFCIAVGFCVSSSSSTSSWSSIPQGAALYLLIPILWRVAGLIVGIAGLLHCSFVGWIPDGKDRGWVPRVRCCSCLTCVIILSFPVLAPARRVV